MQSGLDRAGQEGSTAEATEGPHAVPKQSKSAPLPLPAGKVTGALPAFLPSHLLARFATKPPTHYNPKLSSSHES